MTSNNLTWLYKPSSSNQESLDQLLSSALSQQANQSLAKDCTKAVLNQAINSGALIWALTKIEQHRLEPMSLHILSRDIIVQYIKQGQAADVLNLLESFDVISSEDLSKCIDILYLGNNTDIEHFLHLKANGIDYHAGAYCASIGDTNNMEYYFKRERTYSDVVPYQAEMILMHRCYADWKNKNHSELKLKLDEAILYLQEQGSFESFKAAVLIARLAADYGDEYQTLIEALLNSAMESVEQLEHDNFVHAEEYALALDFITENSPDLLEKVLTESYVEKTLIERYLKFYEKTDSDLTQLPFIKLMLSSLEEEDFSDAPLSNEEKEQLITALKSKKFPLIYNFLSRYDFYLDAFDTATLKLALQLESPFANEPDYLQNIFDDEDIYLKLDIISTYLHYSDKNPVFLGHAKRWFNRTFDVYRKSGEFDSAFLFFFFTHLSKFQPPNTDAIVFISKQLLTQDPNYGLAMYALKASYLLKKHGITEHEAELRSFIPLCLEGKHEALVEFNTEQLIDFVCELQDYDTAFEFAFRLNNDVSRYSSISKIIVHAGVNKHELINDLSALR